MRILLTGGGTGGHIYPALSLINKIKELNPDAKFLYIGTERGLESKIVPAAGIPFETINIQGFKRSLSMKNVQTLHLFFKSISRSRKLIKEFKPDIVIGTGGYVCGAVVYAAYKEKIPTMIHEQNSIPGITNKFLAKYVNKVCICFQDAAKYFPENKVVLTGNPRGEELVDKKKSEVLATYGLAVDKKTVLIFGGSQGALKINDVMIESLDQLEKKDYQVLYVSGERYFEKIHQEILKRNSDFRNIKVVPYIDNMTDVLVNVQLVVSRAGATTIAEVTALGIPTILIPSPYVTNDHQTKNAESLVKVGAAKMIANDELTAVKLINELDGIFENEDNYQKMVTSSKTIGIPDAATRMYHLMLTLLKK